MKKSQRRSDRERLLSTTPNISNFVEAHVTEGDATDENCFFDLFNKLYQAYLGKLTMGVSPAALGGAYCAWMLQLAQSPGHLLALTFYPAMHASDNILHMLCDSEAADGKDIRFCKESWQVMPWRLYAENFLLVEDWWRQATTEVPGLSSRVERTVSFCARQILDALSPSNFAWTNPDLFEITMQTGGANLIQGTEIAINNILTKAAGLPPPGAEKFIPGKNVAITPGKIVFSNHLIELIQYEPQTKTVYKEPILIIPAWIMKYYILDLSPDNSLVKWLVAEGHTVFIISWRNPGEEDRNLSMDDYYRQGAMAAIDTVSAIIPKTEIHLMGYCLGGTLAMIVAAAMARHEDRRLKSLSLLAAQGDFTEAGELMLFITESEISFLENMMWEKGYLDTKQMSGSFQMLRSYDLIWSKIIDDYLHGKQRGMVDLLAWNADATRMPYKMHTEYLEKLFLNNAFAEGNFRVEGRLVAPKNIQLPIFGVSTEKDHVAPWKSVYKIHLMTNTDITFVLTSGGHNAGVISEPNHKGRSYFINEHKKNTPYYGPMRWLKSASKHEGSWWFAWHDWLVQQSASKRVTQRTINPALPSAPGAYILQK
jgi:polyhydroxyalkanoate synthase subunit PhaC